MKAFLLRDINSGKSSYTLHSTPDKALNEVVSIWDGALFYAKDNRAVYEWDGKEPLTLYTSGGELVAEMVPLDVDGRCKSTTI